MQVQIEAKGRNWTLTDERAESTHGMPVLVDNHETAHGPWDVASHAIGSDGMVQAMTYARAIASYAKDDTEDLHVHALVDRFNAVPQ